LPATASFATVGDIVPLFGFSYRSVF
jgi:hypothetical protein